VNTFARHGRLRLRRIEATGLRPERQAQKKAQTKSKQLAAEGMKAKPTNDMSSRKHEVLLAKKRRDDAGDAAAHAR